MLGFPTHGSKVRSGEQPFRLTGELGMGAFGRILAVGRDSVARGWDLAVPYARVMGTLVCPGVELPYPAPMGTGWGHRRGLEWHKCIGRQMGTRTVGSWELPLSPEGSLGKPWVLQPGGLGQGQGDFC